MELNKKVAKKSIWYIGQILTLCCVLYLVFQLYSQRDIFVEQGLLSVDLRKIIWGSVLWLMCNTTIAFGWKMIMQGNQLQSSLLGSLIVIYRTQIGKYLPGNIFHFAGRMVSYKESEISFKKSGIFLIHEIALTVLSAGMLGFISLLHWGWAFWLFPLGYMVIGFVVCVFIDFSTIKFRRLPSGIFRKTGYYSIAAVMYSIGVVCMFFILLLAVEGDSELGLYDKISLFGASTLSWLAGFVTPGSPGGLGVREAVFVNVNDVISMEKALYGIVWVRFCSIIGDALSFIISHPLKWVHSRLET